jgi:hypothetical protein
MDSKESMRRLIPLLSGWWFLCLSSRAETELKR